MMQRVEFCNGKYCAEEILALGQVNMKMWYLFEWLSKYGELQHGTQANVIKLYVEEKLVAYSLLENYEARTDKTKVHKGAIYQDLGVIHFVTLPTHRNKGFGSLLASLMYKEMICPLILSHSKPNKHVYVTATKRAVPLMQRTGIPSVNLVTEFYSEHSFEKIVAKQVTPNKY